MVHRGEVEWVLLEVIDGAGRKDLSNDGDAQEQPEISAVRDGWKTQGCL